MNDECAAKEAWLKWNKKMREIAELIGRDNTAALALVERHLSHESVPEIRSEALGFRADIKERMGDLESAREDLLVAQRLVEPSYKKYVHELWLGALSEKLGRIDEALSWYREALETCLAAGGISAGDVLGRILRLRDEARLSAEDRSLCEHAAQKSWEFLRLPGHPDPKNLSAVVAAIRHGEENPLRP